MSEQIRIIKKKGKGHGGHHGGAWKVAYADFMTAMMTFFLVMWIIGLNQPTKEAIAGYFQDPTGFMKAFSGGSKPFGDKAMTIKPGTKIPEKMGVQDKATGKGNENGGGAAEERKRFEKVKRAIDNVVAHYPEFKNLKESIHVKIVADGLRIDLVESSSDLFFDSGSAATKPRTRSLLGKIAHELGKLPNDVVVEGHTDSRPYCGPNGWTNWELSTARANAARAVMSGSGLRNGQIIEVRGLADTRPIDAKHKDSFKNRRVSILLPFQQEVRKVGSIEELKKHSIHH